MKLIFIFLFSNLRDFFLLNCYKYIIKKLETDGLRAFNLLSEQNFCDGAGFPLGRWARFLSSKG